MADGKHPKRFIVEVKGTRPGDKWFRSGNSGLSKPFYERAEAEAALNTPDAKSPGVQYRIRTK